MKLPLGKGRKIRGTDVKVPIKKPGQLRHEGFMKCSVSFYPDDY